MSRSRKLALTLVSAVLTWNLAVRAAGAGTVDTWITTKARIVVLTTDGAGRSAVKVDSNDGLVTLRGRVSSQAEKDKAEAAVRGVDGVTEVRNLVEVLRWSRWTGMRTSDSDVRKTVEAALKAHRAFDGVLVESVNDGVVLLDGWTATLAEQLRAIQATYDCEGVRQVASQIQTSDR